MKGDNFELKLLQENCTYQRKTDFSSIPVKTPQEKFKEVTRHPLFFPKASLIEHFIIQ